MQRLTSNQKRKSANDSWIEPVIKVILIVSALLAIGGIITVAHFVLKFW